MTTPITSEHVRRIWYDHEGVALEISDPPDSTEMLQLSTYDDKAEEWFGKVDIMLDPAFAVALGNALVELGKRKIRKAKP